MLSLKNLPIKIKLFMAYALVYVTIFLLSFSLLFFQVQKNLIHRIKEELSRSNQTITDMVETAATISIKNHLRAISEKNREILE
ncbi:MAG: diguanylate cyclase, partial [Desulfobacterales bacterium]|nr:diguanylate cyclase [Desulfobacterales bacterium]